MRTISLRVRYVLLTSCIAGLVACVIGSIAYTWIARFAAEKATASLVTSAKLIAPRVKDGFDILANDAVLISHMPPIRGLMRAIKAGGTDPVDVSSVTQWRERLESIFESLLARRPDYVQLRLIGVADNGRELVRVNSDDSTVETVSEERLQQKAGEPYFQNSLSLQPGDVYFSTITLNRDFGLIEGKAVLRAVTAVRDDSGGIFGLVVINVDFSAMLERIAKPLVTEDILYLATDTGDFVRRLPDGTVSNLVLRGTDNPLMRDLLDTARIAGEQGTSLPVLYKERPSYVAQAAVQYDDNNPDRFTEVVLIADQQNLFVAADELRQKMILWGVALVTFIVGVAYAASRALTRPLQEVIDGIRAFVPGRSREGLPLRRQDEIGDLARSFNASVQRHEDAMALQRSALVRLQAILDNTPDGIVTISAAGTVESFNTGAAGIFGYSADSVVGKSVEIILPTFNEISEGPEQSKTCHGSAELEPNAIRELKGKSKTGEEIPIELSIATIALSGENIRCAIVRDISQRKRMEQQVKIYTTELERSNQELDEFAYIASHDLKEPLRAIHTHVQFLEEDYGPVLGDEGAKRVDRIKTLCKRADKLMSDLLYFSRLGRGEVAREQVDMKQAAEKAVQQLQELLHERNTSVEIRCGIPDARGDATRLTSLFYNLVSNGTKYNNKEEKIVEIGYYEDMDNVGGDGSYYYVRDNGIGIPDEFKEAVFKMFKRLHPEKRYGPGTGAGLSFCRKIVERHGGKLWFRSREGEGTTFCFTLS